MFSYPSSVSSPEEQPQSSFNDMLLLPDADWLSMPPSSVLFPDSMNTWEYPPAFQQPPMMFGQSMTAQTSLPQSYWGNFGLSAPGSTLQRSISTPSSSSASDSDADQHAPPTGSLVMPTEEEYRLYELAQGTNPPSPCIPADLSNELQWQAASPAGSSLQSPTSTAQMKVSRSSSSQPIDDAASEGYWQAVLARDGAAVGPFWYGVTSTKIYCRPSCASRRPMRTNVVFFESLQDADAAGYRPCKRCRPTDILEPSVVRQTTSVFQAATLIEESVKARQKPPSLTQLAQAVRMSPFYFQRTFKKHYGVSPKVYAMHLTKARLSQT